MTIEGAVWGLVIGTVISSAFQIATLLRTSGWGGRRGRK